MVVYRNKQSGIKHCPSCSLLVYYSGLFSYSNREAALVLEPWSLIGEHLIQIVLDIRVLVRLLCFAVGAMG